MGKGTIVSGGAAGNYQVTLDYGKATRDAELVKIAERLAELVDEIAAAEATVDALQAAQDSLTDAVNVAIAAYATAARLVPPDPAAVKDAMAVYTEAATALTDAKSKTAVAQLPLDLLKDERASLQKIQTTWTALTLEETVQAWCADLTEDATGFVATVEVPGESRLVLIAPQAPAPTDADGLLTAREVQQPHQVFFNAAILPGWQKYKPTFRRGIITALHSDTDTADVTLEATDKSSAQALNINQTAALSAVPVKYMSCNAAAFEVGDRCVVQFKNQDWSQPEVIGFVDNPKPCALILSGAIKGGTLSDLPIPPGSPEGTVAKKTLNTYKPTLNAWQYPLKSDPAKSPSAFSPEPILGKAGTQYQTLSASMFSGRMAKAVQVIMGMGLSVAYDCRWAKCHGITLAADGKPWLVEISAVNGVLATLMELTAAPPTSTIDAVNACSTLFGGIPKNKPMPTGAALTAAITAGTVLQLLTPAAMAPFFSGGAISEYMGWSFNDTGSEAHNTCHKTASGIVTSYHYKLTISIEGGSALSEVSSGQLSKIQRTAGGEFEQIPFFAEGAGYPVTEVIAGQPRPIAVAPVLVCHVNGALHVINAVVTFDDATSEDTYTYSNGGSPFPWLYYRDTRTRRIQGHGVHVEYPGYVPADSGYLYETLHVYPTHPGSAASETSGSPAITTLYRVAAETITENTSVYKGSVVWGRFARDGYFISKATYQSRTIYAFQCHGIELRSPASDTDGFSISGTPGTPPGFIRFQYAGQDLTIAIPAPTTPVASPKAVDIRPGVGASITFADSPTLWGASFPQFTYSMFGSGSELSFGALHFRGDLLASETPPTGNLYNFVGYI